MSGLIGSNLFDTQMIFLIFVFEKVDFEKNQIQSAWHSNGFPDFYTPRKLCEGYTVFELSIRASIRNVLFP